MKNKDLKKGKESIIGKIIYGFLLFMPLIAIGVTCITNFFNKEDSVQIINKYETNEVTNYRTDLQRGNIYKLTLNQFPSSNGIYQLELTELYNFDTYEHYSINADSETSYYMLIELRTDSIMIRTDGYTSLITSYNPTLPFSFDFVYYGKLNDNDLSMYFTITSTDFNIIDNVINQPREEVFYRSVDKVEQSSLFNWAENSLIYTGIANTCTQLSITNTFIPLLLAYWLIISVIYILYDIILMILIILHNKVHQIQDSI